MMSPHHHGSKLSGEVLAFCLVFSTLWRCLDALTAHPFPWVWELAGIDGSAELFGSLKDTKSMSSFRARHSEVKTHQQSCQLHLAPGTLSHLLSTHCVLGMCWFCRQALKHPYLQQVSAFAWSQATHILQQSLAVGVSNGPVHIHPHLVHTVDEFAVERVQQLLLHHVLLAERRGVSPGKDGSVQPSATSQTQHTGSLHLGVTPENSLKAEKEAKKKKKGVA